MGCKDGQGNFKRDSASDSGLFPLVYMCMYGDELSHRVGGRLEMLT